MEWPDFENDPLQHHYQHHCFSPEIIDHSSWSLEENKLFENALAELQPDSPGFFETLASCVPWKPINDITTHYQSLLRDVEMIESDLYPVPKYTDSENNVKKDHEEVGGLSVSNSKRTKKGRDRRRGVPWTEDEHQLFLMGLHRYGKGDWRSISRYYVITKTPTQVASHAQKYFRRQTCSTPAEKRRPSIHDIQTTPLINWEGINHEGFSPYFVRNYGIPSCYERIQTWI